MTQPCQRHMTCAWLQPLTGLAPLCHLCMPACTVRSASKALQSQSPPNFCSAEPQAFVSLITLVTVITLKGTC